MTASRRYSSSSSAGSSVKMPSPLDNLVAIGKLKVEQSTQAEIDGLMHSGSARINDAENDALSLESRFDLA